MHRASLGRGRTVAVAVAVAGLLCLRRRPHPPQGQARQVRTGQDRSGTEEYSLVPGLEQL